MPTKEYLDYLSSPQWKQRSTRFKAAANWCCEHCRSEVDIEVHHLNYRSLGTETWDDVMVLCQDCHTWADNLRRHGTESQYSNMSRGKDAEWLHEMIARAIEGQ